MATYDAIIVAGGGVRAGGEFPPYVRRRLDRAIEVQGDAMVIASSAGTVHRPPPLDADGFPIFESVAAGHYLIARGVNPHTILPETCSYDTIGNAYFARTIHVDPRGFRRLLVITSAFHMPRTEAIFRWVFGLDVPPGGYKLDFESVSDEDIPSDVLAARIERERASLDRLPATIARIGSMRALNEWLYTEHAAYAVGLKPDKAAGRIVDTY
jgi:uncharacterized SAM-binding protein YcdF (DUF218 family)